MEILRRKMGGAGVAAGGPGAERAWRLALARAARDHLGLALDVSALRDERVSLGELIEMPAERSLLAVLDAAAEGLGLVAVDPALLAAMVAMLTTGRVVADAQAPRRPTRTDAAMLAPMVDAALAGLFDALAGQDDAAWAEGWRYASFLEEPRPLALLLEDTTYRVLRAEVGLMQGAVTGTILLALPAGQRARPVAAPVVDEGAFRAAFARQVEGVACRMEAELVRLTLPLSRALGLQVGEVLPLGEATVGRLVLRGIDGQVLAEGKLGQMRGMRAVRLALAVAEDEALRLAG
ncbi:flagellar motor switch protein FliM [Paragemmobacter straminiformis]|uniref:FliM/FliN family flagellar motor switch protein n=1 Tax=Paragemmobacter straminiformis TaxID=2045119 RepID=A0A842I4Z7_9RHOB|nr:flagellar motor switch protein FliM [Gemmobacter straminiformis]MBC2835202.1 FliM/FliN family flagellar motor switch protein [Gemmobacter straminiformis]